MLASLNISGQGKRRGRGNTPGGSSSLVRWVRGGLIILGAIGTVFGTPSRYELSPNEEKETLKMKASHLKQQLAEIENRIATLEREQESKVIEYKGNTE
ncbi:MAG: hypothetical protein ABFD82_20755 [Syntrophaceae bacterium]